jgi:ABC-type glutathione transport system ATPase component
MKTQGKAQTLKQPLTDGEQRSSEKPDSPSQFEWKEINYVLHKGNKQVLFDAFGTVKKGEICALIGSSGAGKTTLLNVLAHKIKSNTGRVTGEFSFDGIKIKTAEELKRFAAYLRQDDFFHPNMTPRQVLQFALDLTSTIPQVQKKLKIEDTLAQLNLSKCADSRVVLHNIRLGTLNPKVYRAVRKDGFQWLSSSSVIQPSFFWMSQPQASTLSVLFSW